MLNFVQREQLETLGDLLAFQREVLAEQPNLGRKSIEDTRQAIVGALVHRRRDTVKHSTV
jgi:DNA-directed RNA polymerase alpha subunit